MTSEQRMGAVERRTARVLPVRRDGRVLMLRGCTPERPEKSFWFTVGGEIELGEHETAAAVRELREETGIDACEEDLSDPFPGPSIEFTWSGKTFVNHQTFFALVIDEGAQISFAGQDE